MLAIIWVLIFGVIVFFLVLRTLFNLRNDSKNNEVEYVKKPSVIWIVIWVTTVIFISFFVLSSWFFSLTTVNKSKIIGRYEVDTTFYPGVNANWQQQHYRFEVRPHSQFAFFERLADGSEKMYLGNITWANEKTEKWSISMDIDHHVVPLHPVLYRERFGFYYVFKTKKYGNMFFRKVSGIGFK